MPILGGMTGLPITMPQFQIELKTISSKEVTWQSLGLPHEWMSMKYDQQQ